MKKRLLSLALALSVLCQAALCLAFAPFESINTTVPSLKGIGTNFDPIAPGQKTPGGITPIANLAANSEVYVKTVRDWFRWEPTSLATADDIEVVNPTANGANQGRFIRLFRANPSWRGQPAWFVSTAGSDENDGATSLTPVKTDLEILRRWGIGKRARLSVPVTITYAQSPTGQTNYAVEVVSGGSLTLVGTPTVTKAGTTISAVQTQVRTAGAEAPWAITGTGLGASEVGKFVVITASGTPANINAYARVLKDETGGKVRVSPFGTYASTTSPFTQATPQVGDTIEIREMATVLSVGLISTVAGANDVPLASPTRNAVVFDSVTLDGNASSTNGAVSTDRLSVHYARTVLKDVLLTGVVGSTGVHSLNGSGTAGASLSVRGTSVIFRQSGLSSNFLTVSFGGSVTMLADTYLQNCGLSVARGAIANTQGIGVFDRVASNSGIVVNAGGFCQQTGAVADWGTANGGHGVTVQSSSGYSYATKPTVNSGLGAGREAQVGGTDKLYSAVPYVEATNNAALVATQ